MLWASLKRKKNTVLGQENRQYCKIHLINKKFYNEKIYHGDQTPWEKRGVTEKPYE